MGSGWNYGETDSSDAVHVPLWAIGPLSDSELSLYGYGTGGKEVENWHGIGGFHVNMVRLWPATPKNKHQKVKPWPIDFKFVLVAFKVILRNPVESGQLQLFVHC